jgi:CMP-N-acetylneuraminic acid synthetase
VIYEMPWERSINIDVQGDFLIAKALIESGLAVSEPGP